MNTLAFDAKRFAWLAFCAHAVRHLRLRLFIALTLVLFSAAAFSAVEQVAPASPAESIPLQSAVDTVAPVVVGYSNGGHTYDWDTWASICATPAPGCGGTYVCAAYDRLVVDFYSTPENAAKYGYYICAAFLSSNGLPTGGVLWRISAVKTCPVPAVNPNVPYTYNQSTGLCERAAAACPTATPAYTLNPATNMCERPAVCPMPITYPEILYTYNPANQMCERQVSVCPVTKLDDITDPVALLYENGTYNGKKPDIEHLTPATQAGLACIQQKVAATNCYMTPQPTSGYRPTAYQTHILEVYDKWQLLESNNAPECAEVKAAVKKEFDHHKPFARRPGGTSNHSQVDVQGSPAGNAVDISFVPDDANVSADAIACQCNMYRPLINMPNPKDNDPVHYQPRTCPR